MDEQGGTSGRWSWLQIGGILSGVAALITAIATMIATVHSVWSPSSSATGTAKISERSVGGSNSDATEPEESGAASKDGKTIAGSKSHQDLAPGDTAVGLWPANGCPYRVTVLDSLAGTYRVLFEFGNVESLSLDTVYPITTEPVPIGTDVFATTEELKGRWMPGVVTQMEGETFHVKHDPEHPCEFSAKSSISAKIEDLAIR